MFKIILNYILGYVNIEIDGYYIEKFINQCMKQYIFLWGINRNKNMVIKAKIGVSDIEKAKELAQKNQCIIVEKNKKGLPIIWNKYKKRKSLFIPLIVIIILIWGLSNFIWNIEIQGNKNINPNEIMDIAKSNGIKIATLKNKINIDEFINKVREQREDIAWIGIEIKGTNLIIKIVEAEAKPEIIDENDYCNIVATKSGTIKKIYAQNGTAQVKEGDEVKAGDILIAGWMEGNYTEKQFVHGSGVVKAVIKYSKSIKIDKKEKIREQTGQKEKKNSIKLNNFQINFYKRLSKFKKYDTIYTEKKLQLFPNFYLPISFITNTIYEVDEKEEINTELTATKKAEENLKPELDELINGEIINSTTEVAEFDNYYYATVTYEVLEEIGANEKIEN